NKLKIIAVKTDKQAGDIAGTKSRKFFEFLALKLGREFNIKIKEFEYNDNENLGYLYLVLEKREDEIVRVPSAEDAHNLARFKKVHKNAFIKNDIAYAKIKHDLSFKEFIQRFKTKEKKIINLSLTFVKLNPSIN
ncbi:MAG: hypothetical protein NT076_03925, partial [Candidatus Pacearchaeota archaeon]|nr:hypothetical protein [Candidatus Pacearchaeota archaeon]